MEIWKKHISNTKEIFERVWQKQDMRKWLFEKMLKLEDMENRKWLFDGWSWKYTEMKNGVLGWGWGLSGWCSEIIHEGKNLGNVEVGIYAKVGVLK